MKSVRLTPSYDLVSTAVYEQSTREIAFHIGGELLNDHINPDFFRNAACEIGFSERMAVERFDWIRDRFISGLKQSAELLSDSGYPKASEIRDKAIRTGGISLL